MFGQLIFVPKIVRFIISGGLAAVVNFAFLYVLTEFFHFWYLLSSACAFFLAIAVSFFLQKHWTFENYEKESTIRQFSVFGVIAGVNLLLNTALVFFFVEKIGLWYMSAQFISSGFIAVESYFVQKKIFTQVAYQESNV
jgi:putative flippase GtrA